MTYIEGFVTPVPTANREKYLDHARTALAIFEDFGATRLVEGWPDDLHRGTLNDFWTAVDAREGEDIAFSWIEYPDKAVRDAANARLRDDPRMADLRQMPFDGARMIYAGFKPEQDEGPGGAAGYIDGFMAPVPAASKSAYFAMAREMAAIFLEFGATRLVETWGDDVSHGQQTDYFRAVRATGDEGVVFSWIEWPSKEVRVAGWEKAMADPRMQPPPEGRPFDGKRIIYGGFTPILDSKGA